MSRSVVSLRAFLDLRPLGRCQIRNRGIGMPLTHCDEKDSRSAVWEESRWTRNLRRNEDGRWRHGTRNRVQETVPGSIWVVRWVMPSLAIILEPTARASARRRATFETPPRADPGGHEKPRVPLPVQGTGFDASDPQLVAVIANRATSYSATCDAAMTGDDKSSPERSDFLTRTTGWSRQLWEIIRRAFAEFLTIPTFVVAPPPFAIARPHDAGCRRCGEWMSDPDGIRVRVKHDAVIVRQCAQAMPCIDFIASAARGDVANGWGTLMVEKEGNDGFMQD